MPVSLYCVDIRPLRLEALPARGRAAAHDCALKLLEYAVRCEFGAAIPEILLAEGGKPFFAGRGDIHFSYSHTRSHILCAVSSSPEGADIETHREVSDILVSRVMSTSRLRELDFFELWTLRESLYKLYGAGSLLSGEFLRTDGAVIPPVPGVCCRVYDLIPGCTAAAASEGAALPDEIIFVPTEEIFPGLQQI